jgi:hypothetical protein
MYSITYLCSTTVQVIVDVTYTFVFSTNIPQWFHKKLQERTDVFTFLRMRIRLKILPIRIHLLLEIIACRTQCNISNLTKYGSVISHLWHIYVYHNQSSLENSLNEKAKTQPNKKNDPAGWAALTHRRGHIPKDYETNTQQFPPNNNFEHLMMSILVE